MLQPAGFLNQIEFLKLVLDVNPHVKAGVAGTASAAEWQQALSKFGLSFQFIEANRILNDMFFCHVEHRGTIMEQ